MAPRKPPRVTARSIIETGLLAGTPPDEILRQVHTQLPDSAADLSHIKFYQARLKKEQRLTEQTTEEGETIIAPRADVPKMGWLGDIELAGVRIHIYGCMCRTDDQAKGYDEVHPRDPKLYTAQVLTIYRALTGDQRLTVNTQRARRIVRRAINVEWYRFQDLPVPERLTQRLEADMAKAKAAPVEEQEENGGEEAQVEKPARVTVKGIITQGLLAGTPDADILAEVKEHFPDGKADGSHISYYRSKLYKSGDLERPVKAEAADEVEGEVEGEAEAEAPKSKAAKKAAPAKAAPAKAAPAKAAPAAAKRAPARR